MVTNNSSNEPTAASGKVLQGQGVGTANNFSTATYPAVGTGTGTLLRADGTNWVATTSTYPNTNAVSTLLYASASNVMSALTTANNGLLVTSNTGVPSVLAGPGAAGKVLQSNTSAAPSFSTPTYPSASGTSRKILVSDGTNNVYSTETWAVPGTSGNVLTSDGTNWTSAAPASTSVGFEAIVHTAQSNVTGDGTTFIVVWDQVIWSSGSGYNSGTGIFTVPAGGAGKYLLTYGLTLTGLGVLFTSAEFGFLSSVGVMTRKIFNPSSPLVSGQLWITDSIIVSRAVGDTIYVQGAVSGSTKTISTVADSFGPFGYFSLCKL